MDNKELLNILEEVATLFVNNEEKKGYTLLMKAIPMLEKLSCSIVEKENGNPLLAGLQTLVEAMENQDIWMMADVIQCELIPVIQNYN